MKTKKLISVLAAALITSSAFAFGPQSMQNQMQPMPPKHNIKDGKKHKRGNSVIAMVMKLDLSKEQRTKIRDIIKNARCNSENVSDAFTKTSFNKSKFIQILENKKQNGIKQYAELIEKIYNVLNDNQKEQLKLMLEMRKLKQCR
ncbi:MULTISPECIES: Spy/CpxP family protein refolding chaperone [unclassified Lebetimonas]|uniref:Spy/CpxP family protein refolding chaperone n=1 Tax=unclassified Lebetimonas TaxID=2648158 RepID=UPI0004648185|nr:MULTISPECIES: Spy/CpxP family protein refolding chaperone [unclassified Lebetimonas]